MTFWNGLTVALDKLGSPRATPTQIIDFMKLHGFNALRIYTGWGNGKNVTGSFYSGDIYHPIGSWARGYCQQLFTQCVANGFLCVVSIGIQYTSFSLDYPNEIQKGYTGTMSSSKNWMDVKGKNFQIMMRNLVREFTELMTNTQGMIAWISLDEVTYTTASEGGAAFYASDMKDAFMMATGKTVPPKITSSYATCTPEQQEYMNFVKQAIADFHVMLHNEAYLVNPEVRFGAMLDYVWNLTSYLRDVQPLDYYATLNNMVAEWFYGIQMALWTGTRSLPDCYNKIYALNPTAKHYFNYGRITYTGAEAVIRRLIPELITKGYDGGFLYEYSDIANNTTVNYDFLSLTGEKPSYQALPPPPDQPSSWEIMVSVEGVVKRLDNTLVEGAQVNLYNTTGGIHDLIASGASNAFGYYQVQGSCLTSGSGTLRVECTFGDLTSTVNLAPLDDGSWFSDTADFVWEKAPVFNVFKETVVTHNGAPTFRIEPDTYSGHKCAGVDHWSPSVKVGETYKMSCWIKTTGTNPIAFAGARIGLDWYDADGIAIGGASDPISANRGYGSDPTAENDNYVKWGSDWTYKEWLFTIPAVIQANGQNPSKYPLGTTGVPALIVPWLQIWTWGSTPDTQYPNGAYTSYFSDFKLVKVTT